MHTVVNSGDYALLERVGGVMVVNSLDDHRVVLASADLEVLSLFHVSFKCRFSVTEGTMSLFLPIARKK